MSGEALPGYTGVTSLWRAAIWRLADAMLLGVEVCDITVELSPVGLAMGV